MYDGKLAHSTMLQTLNGQAVGLPDHGERRALLRWRPLSVIYVRAGPQNGGVVLDISENGLQLSAGETLGDDALPLSLQLSYGVDPIEATGQIVWLSDSRRTAGLQFVSLPEQDRTRLRDWIASDQKASGASGQAPTSQPDRAPILAPASQPPEAPASVEVAPLPSERLLGTQPRSAPPVLEEEADEFQSVQSAHATFGTEPLPPVCPPADHPSGPSRDDRTDAPLIGPSDVVQSIRQLFPQNQIVDNKRSWGAPPAREASILEAAEPARTSELQSESVSFPFEEDRRPDVVRIMLAGGLMLLCFAVGLIVGVRWLARPAHPETPSATNPMTNVNPGANADTAARSSTTSNTDANRTPSVNRTTPRGRNLTTRPAMPSLARPPASLNPTPAPRETEPSQPALPQPSAPVAALPEYVPAISPGVELTPPAEGAPAVWVRLPQAALSASASVAISLQQSVLVSPAAAPGAARSVQVLVGGRILSSSIEPLESAAPIDPAGDVVHLRVWIDSQGGIRQITPGDGRADLIAIAEGEVRGWVQTPARLSGRPIDSVEDVTITFRP